MQKLYIIIIWIVLWIFFTARGFVVDKDKSTFKDYANLVCADWDGKRAIVFGKDLYEFLKFCKTNLPPEAGYEVVGMSKDFIDLPRLVYYLYPSIKDNDPKFILVYKKPGFSKEDTYPYASLNKESFILKYK